MKLVILGAGASFDSVYDFYDEKEFMPWRPPLANELFDTRVDFRNIIESYPGGSYYLSKVNAIQDIEEFFQKQWLFLKNNRAIDLASAFLNLNYCLAHLMFQISNNYKNVGLSNYDILIQSAYEYAISQNEEVIFITFNYDTLLENSFVKLYFGDNRKLDIPDYIKSPLKIIKPHGSCNWVRRFSNEYKIPDTISISNYLFQNKTSLREINKNLEEGIYSVDNPIGGKYFGDPGQVWNCFPQLLIPLKDKDDFILPKPHNEYLENNIGKVDEILIIGWKGTEAKFQNLLRERIGSRKVSVTSVNAGFTDIENVLAPSLPGAEFYHYKEEARIAKYDNRKVLGGQGLGTTEITKGSGTFSAYTVNIHKQYMTDYFKI